jgi:hypothetical protein
LKTAKSAAGRIDLKETVDFTDATDRNGRSAPIRRIREIHGFFQDQQPDANRKRDKL